jgi:acyl-CoA synthetase (AMP-forming)/AMP-acid ligase II
MTNLIECSAAAYSCPLLIKHLLETALARAPKQEIVYRSQARLTYRDFRDRVGKLASGLAKLGVRPGQTVAVMDFDSHRYLECFFAVPMMGATLHTINVRLSPEQILYTINHARDDIILVNSEFAPILEQIWDRVEGVTSLLWIDDAGGAPKTTLPFVAEYETLLAGADAQYVFPDFHEDTRATTFYTTGTTGLPKGVYFSHRQLALHTLSLRNAITGTGHGRLNDGDVYMPVTPMFHVHAWGFPYVATTLGLKQVYPGKYAPDLVLDLIAREKVTFSHCVPTILQMILAHPKSKEGVLKGWKVIVGGAALPRALAKEAMQHGIDITTGYGMSETCPVLTLAHLRAEDEAWDVDRQVEVRIKAGRPIPLVDLRVVDPEMRDVPRDGTTPGEIVARAPWLTQGYLRDPANSEKLWLGGWLHTGDIGVIGPDGYLKITDRLKDVIKTGGEWVSSLDIEDLILKQPGVGEAAVIGIPDPKWTERPLAVVVLKQGSSVTDCEIRAALQEYASKGVISRYAVPDQVVFVSALPRTSVGKLDKKLLREQFRDYRAAPSATPSSPAMRPAPAEARAQQA